MNNLIILEDDKDILANLTQFLIQEKFNVTQSSRLSQFKTAIKKDKFALAIIDLGLPDGSGLDAVSWLRQNTQVGIIVLTASDGFNEKMKGYEAGADYYFTKPTHPPELVAAARSIIARLNQQPISSDNYGWQLYTQDWLMKCPKGNKIPLTNKEMLFMTEIINSPGYSTAKENLLKLLGYEAKGLHGKKALDVMVTRLRKKIKDITGDTAPIKTIHQVGFKFSENIRMN